MGTLALCIPAYNAGVYLPQLLTSAANQHIPFDEILVYNDCSTDDTAQVAERYGAKVISGDANVGCSSGKNMLAENTFCDWIHFHDADDDLLPDFTTLAHQWMNNPACPDIVLFNYEYRDYQTNELLGIRNFNKALLEKDAITYAISEQINPFCGLYKKQSFLNAGGYDTDPLVLYYEDAAFHIKMALAGLKFSAEETISIINYRINSSMSVVNNDKCLIAQYYALQKTALQAHPNHAHAIASKLWGIVGPFAARLKWDYVKKILSLCDQLGYRQSPVGSNLFRALTYLDPYLAVKLREKAIRLLKPHLRNNA